MNNDSYAQLEKLASEAIARVAELEEEVNLLREENSKQAAAVFSPSDEAVESALEGLLKSGSLLPEQIELTRQSFKNDPEAALRAVVGLTLDACTQVKTASSDDLSGGSLTVSSASADYREDLCNRMMAILNR